MENPRLNKRLYTEISRLKLLNQKDSLPRFQLERSPFSDDDEQTSASNNSNAILIIGRIFPNSDIYKSRTYTIEINILATYPSDPPEVRFLTPVHHPNVARDGKICQAFLKKTAQLLGSTSLVDVVKTVTDLVDNPDPEHSFNIDLARQYVGNQAEFNRKTLECTQKHVLSRD